MTEVILERQFDPALTPEGVMNLAIDASSCFGIHRIEWRVSHLALDGHKMICHFTAPDMESMRIAMRQSRIDDRKAWRGNVHDAPGVDEKDVRSANVLVERSFEEPVDFQQIQNIEEAGIACLESRDVRFLRSYFSQDQKRMICLYEAPDAESVRQAQREAGVPFNDAWAYRAISP